MKWLAMLALLAGAITIYWMIIRPYLCRQPFFEPLFARLDDIEAGWWAKLKAWFTISKTINYGNLQIAAGVLATAIEQFKALDFGLVWPQWAGVILFAMGLATILLRMMTIEPLADKAQP